MGLPIEQTELPQAYPLSELLEHIRQLVKSTYDGTYWIVAEVIELSHSRVGHYYFTLGEMQDGKVVAKVQGNLWAGVARSVMTEFERITGGKIEKGMQLMLQVRVEFTPLYGLSLTILGINAEYTLGNLERLKRLAIERLQTEGVFDMNRLLSLPILPLRLAVISSDTAAGWGDFCRHIEQSGISHLLRIKLFPCIMQGAQTTPSILAALDSIYDEREDFDALLVLRGGGSRLDLSAFDDYELCSHLAQMPLPVLSGIGHERDESVADLIAHTRLKTPTALAEFIVRRVEEALTRLFDVEEGIKTLLSERRDEAQEILDHTLLHLRQSLYSLTLNETRRLHRLSTALSIPLRSLSHRSETRLHSLVGSFARTAHRLLSNEKSQLATKQNRLTLSVRERLSSGNYETDRCRDRLTTQLQALRPRQTQLLEHLETVAKTYDPTHIMRRGFLPVMAEGAPLLSVNQLSHATTLTVVLPDGKATAEVKDILPEE